MKQQSICAPVFFGQRNSLHNGMHSLKEWCTKKYTQSHANECQMKNWIASKMSLSQLYAKFINCVHIETLNMWLLSCIFSPSFLLYLTFRWNCYAFIRNDDFFIFFFFTPSCSLLLLLFLLFIFALSWFATQNHQLIGLIYSVLFGQSKKLKRKKKQ